MSVLIVDDDKLVREMLGRFCVSCNIDHHLAANAREALAACEARRFKVVVTDFLMPTTNGINLARKIREKYPETKLFAYTGSCPYGLPDELKAVFDGVFEKPGDTSRMIAEVVKAVSRGAI